MGQILIVLGIVALAVILVLGGMALFSHCDTNFTYDEMKDFVFMNEFMRRGNNSKDGF